MAAKMVKTATPGIYKRGGRYVVVYKVDGRQKKESARTLDEARKLKAARTADIARGEFHEANRVTFHKYARDWVERYNGRGRRGFREVTRDDYRRDLEHYAFKHFGARVRVSEITPLKIAQFVAWLCEQEVPRAAVKLGEAPKPPKLLADATVRRILAPVRACLGSAVAEGVIRHNPTVGVALPSREDERSGDELEDDEDVRVFTREQLGALLAAVDPRHRPFFDVLAATGLRISEAIALRWQDLELTGDKPHVKVRRAYVKGRYGPPKSKYGRRSVPLTDDLATALRKRRMATEWPDDEQLVFPATNGEPMRDENVRRRVLHPASKQAGVPWAGFHTFRHTCASLLFDAGRNAVQVQRWLGHHSPAFTLSTYVHLLEGDVGDPLDIPATLKAPAGGNPVATQATGDDVKDPTATAADLA
jgi:integrase